MCPLADTRGRPGPEEAAGRLAEAGLHVTGVENTLVGGERPYWACIPSKMMIPAVLSLFMGVVALSHGNGRRHAPGE